MPKLYARVLLANPAGYTPEGALFVTPESMEWQPVEWLDPWDCEHQETMCAQCVDTWGIDYEIELPAGIDA